MFRHLQYIFTKVSKIITDETNISVAYGILMLNRWNTEARFSGSDFDVLAADVKYEYLLVTSSSRLYFLIFE
jgi:hypothetical protein